MPETFQKLVFSLQDYWAREGCIIMQPFDLEMGAGTFHPATFLRAIGPEKWSAAYVQPCRRPKMGDTDKIQIGISIIINFKW